MKALLLAAGRSVRMQPIADKNFLSFAGRPLIAHQLEALKRAEFKEILVMGGKHNMPDLKKAAAKFGCAVREQKDLDLGMAGAVLSAASWIKNDAFVIAGGNDMLDGSAYELFRKNIKKGEGLMLAYKVSKYFPGGYLKTDRTGRITGIVEKPGEGREPSKLVNIVLHFHPNPKALSEALKKTDSKRDDRYERAIAAIFAIRETPYRALKYSGFWQPVKYPWHVLPLSNHFLSALKPSRGKNVQIALSAKITGAVVLEDGVRVLDNAVIRGPAYIGQNTIIATNALVRQSHIGNDCVIGFGSEIARSHLGDSVWTHSNYIGDSIIGSDVSFGSGTVTGNLRLDEKNIQVGVNGDRIDSGLKKLGLITGDHIRAGINTSFMPGVKIGSNSFIGAGIVVGQDIPPSSYATGSWELKIRPNSGTISPRVSSEKSFNF